MEAVKLQLFEQDYEARSRVEEKIITPAVEVLNTALPTSSSSFNHLPQETAKSLDDLFPEQQHEEKNIQKAKEILGPLAQEFTAEQLKDTIVEVQFLVESWLDDFERELFDGMTLKELLHDKGGL